MRRIVPGTRFAALLAAWLLLASAAPAQDMVTEVVPAGFRSAEELVAILKPLIPAPGSIAGFHNQLVIKTTPENLAELRQLLASLDKPPANLLVSVRHRLDAEISHDLARARLAVRRGAVNAGINVQQRTRTNQDNSTQRVRVLEGKEAFIQTGESIPVGERQLVITGVGTTVTEGTRYEEFGTGFWARARLTGDHVTLDIFPDQRQRRGGGNATVQRTSTSVSGVLGRWMEIGSVNLHSGRDSSAIGNSRSITTRKQQSTYVKVERVN